MVDISRWTTRIFAQKRLELSRERAFMASVPRKRARFDATDCMATTDSEILGKITQRATANLARSTPAKELLQQNGITDPALWAQYRLGVGDDQFVKEMGMPERLAALGLLPRKGCSPLLPTGLLISTFDPREPNNPVGLVKVNFSQNQHRFLTTPAGLICAPSIEAATKVIIADSPLLGLRLAQAGAANVVVAETPDVLLPLADWLADRTVVATSYKSEGLRTLKSALGTNTTCVLTAFELRLTASSALELMGINAERLEQPAAAPITPQLLRRLTEYAQSRITSGDGLDALKAFEANSSDFIRAYSLGYLPADYRDALSAEDKRTLTGHKLGGCILIPAFDAAGAVADLLAIYPKPDCRRVVALMDPSAGMIAPRVASSFDQVVVTDSFGLAARLFKRGQRNVLFVRGLEDATRNARRLWESGVREATLIARRDGDALSLTLQRTGIVIKREKWPSDFYALPSLANSVEPMVVPQKAAEVALPSAVVDNALRFISQDAKTERAVFKAGSATYSVETDLDTGTKLEVRLENGGKVHLDRFDLAVEAQRTRFATSASLRTQMPVDDISAQLIALLDGVRALHDQQTNPNSSRQLIAFSENERQEALALLKRADLLDVVAGDLNTLGWVGEERAKRLLYLVSISRKLSAPLSAVMMASSGAGKSKGIETISELAPPEDCLHVSRLTDSSLYYHGPDALRHKLLTIDEFDALSPEVIVALRVLQSRGSLSQSHTQRDGFGKTAISFSESRGPVAVLTSSAGQVEEQLLSRCIEVSVDESPRQTQAIVQAHLAQHANPEFGGVRDGVIRRQRNLQRLLECRTVVIPFADRIEFPASSVKHRRTLEKVLGLIQASALLHQHQRLKQRSSNGDEIILADIRDFDIAIALSEEFVSRSTDELSRNARAVLDLIQEAKLDRFDINDLKQHRPEWTRHVFRTGLDELLSVDVLFSPARTRPRKYALNAAAALSATTARIRLRSGPPSGDLAAFGETAFANTNRARVVG